MVELDWACSDSMVNIKFKAKMKKVKAFLRPQRSPNHAHDVVVQQRLNLYRQIHQTIITNEFDHKDFIPEGLIDHIINPESVRSLLASIAPDRNVRETLINFILDKERPAVKALAICLLSNLKDKALCTSLENFIRVDLKDINLPITEEDKDRYYIFDINANPSVETGLDTFLDKQWLFLAPVFNEEELELSLSKKHPLPFISVARNQATGGFGMVHKVTVHGNHVRRTASSVGTILSRHIFGGMGS